jgi:hypothetical protein
MLEGTKAKVGASLADRFQVGAGMLGDNMSYQACADPGENAYRCKGTKL